MKSLLLFAALAIPLAASRRGREYQKSLWRAHTPCPRYRRHSRSAISENFFAVAAKVAPGNWCGFSNGGKTFEAMKIGELIRAVPLVHRRLFGRGLRFHLVRLTWLAGTTLCHALSGSTSFPMTLRTGAGERVWKRDRRCPRPPPLRLQSRRLGPLPHLPPARCGSRPVHPPPRYRLAEHRKVRRGRPRLQPSPPHNPSSASANQLSRCCPSPGCCEFKLETLRRGPWRDLQAQLPARPSRRHRLCLALHVLAAFKPRRSRLVAVV